MAQIEFTTTMNNGEVDVEQGTSLKSGDTLPVFKAQLLDNGDPYDLSGKTAELHMNEEGSDTSSKQIDGSAMNIVDETAGEVEYEWNSSETETSGDFDLEIVVVDDTSSAERTFPTSGFVSVRIFEDLQ